MKSIIFLPEAKEEMNVAARYYESQALGLGADYLSEVERAVASITASPETWPKLEGELRRRLVRRFPFGILYYIESEIVIVAVVTLKEDQAIGKIESASNNQMHVKQKKELKTLGQAKLNQFREKKFSRRYGTNIYHEIFFSSRCEE